MSQAKKTRAQILVEMHNNLHSDRHTDKIFLSTYKDRYKAVFKLTKSTDFLTPKVLKIEFDVLEDSVARLKRTFPHLKNTSTFLSLDHNVSHSFDVSAKYMGRIMGFFFGYIDFVLLSNRPEVVQNMELYYNEFAKHFFIFKKALDVWEGSAHHQFVGKRLIKISKRKNLTSEQVHIIEHCARIMV